MHRLIGLHNRLLTRSGEPHYDQEPHFKPLWEIIKTNKAIWLLNNAIRPLPCIHKAYLSIRRPRSARGKLCSRRGAWKDDWSMQIQVCGYLSVLTYEGTAQHLSEGRWTWRNMSTYVFSLACVHWNILSAVTFSHTWLWASTGLSVHVLYGRTKRQACPDKWLTSSWTSTSLCGIGYTTDFHSLSPVNLFTK